MFALVYVCLCFPRGRLGSRRDRRFVGVLGAVLAVIWVLVLVLAEELPPSGPFAACAAACPRERVAGVRRGGRSRARCWATWPTRSPSPRSSP